MRSQIDLFKLFFRYKQGCRIENIRRYDNCKIDVLRAFYAKHLRNKKHLKINKQDDMIIQEWL